MQAVNIHPYYFSSQKRLFDLFLSSLLLILFSPFLVCLILVLWLSIGWPIFFVQKRAGKTKHTFTLYKFRTMITSAECCKPYLRAQNEAPEPMFKMQQDPRFIGIGRWLSRTGLDELPQLVNIWRGEMSFVGPRPLPVDEAEQLPKSWDFRYLVKPGLVSEWVLSEKKYRSLNAWRQVERKPLQFSNIASDVALLAQIAKVAL